MVTAAEPPSSTPRISFSADFLDEKLGFVSLGPKTSQSSDLEESCGGDEFEFLSTNPSLDSMLSADELFREGKLLPKFWLAEHRDDKSSESTGPAMTKPKKEGGDWRSCNANQDWLVDEDPSPRPPNCTVLWKELLRLRKQRTVPSSPLFSPSSSSSSSSSSMADAKEGKEGMKSAKRMKKGGGLERTSSGNVRIRPMINVPICTVANAARLQQPLFPVKKGRVEW